MIGNTIRFVVFPDHKRDKEKYEDRKEVLEGIVVDAFTDVSGSVSGTSSSGFLGYGSGSVHGNTKSKRMYKVQYYHEWDREKKYGPQFMDIHAWQLKDILKFGNNINQEKNEEKMKLD